MSRLSTMGGALGLAAAVGGGCHPELNGQCYNNAADVDARAVAIDFEEEHPGGNTTENLELTMNLEPTVDWIESDDSGSVRGDVQFVLYAHSDFQDGEPVSDDVRDNIVGHNLVGIASDEQDFRDASLDQVRNVTMNDCDGGEGKNGICVWAPFEKGPCDEWDDVCLSVVSCGDEIVKINNRIGACLHLDAYYDGDTGCDE